MKIKMSDLLVVSECAHLCVCPGCKIGDTQTLQTVYFLQENVIDELFDFLYENFVGTYIRETNIDIL